MLFLTSLASRVLAEEGVVLHLTDIRLIFSDLKGSEVVELTYLALLVTSSDNVIDYSHTYVVSHLRLKSVAHTIVIRLQILAVSVIIGEFSFIGSVCLVRVSHDSIGFLKASINRASRNKLRLILSGISPF